MNFFFLTINAFTNFLAQTKFVFTQSAFNIKTFIKNPKNNYYIFDTNEKFDSCRFLLQSEQREVVIDCIEKGPK